MRTVNPRSQADSGEGASPPLDPGKWVDDYGDMLYRFAVTRVHRPDTAEELVQETFLSALQAKDRFAGRSTERTWLVGILRHKILDYYRSKTRGGPVTEEISHEDWLAPLFDEKGAWLTVPDPKAVQPQVLLEREEFWLVFDGCLDCLQGRAKEAFIRRIMDDEDIDTICKNLSVTATNLYVILFRARTQMRHCLTLKWFQRQET